MRQLINPIRTVDYHTAGEPFRIVVDGAPQIPHATVADSRSFAQQSVEIDSVRRLLCQEPRGHADMYGCFVVPPDDDGADFGALFWHKDGYSTACGHGTIALGVWAVQSGRIPGEPEGETAVVIDVPSGRVTARVRQERGVVVEVTFDNVGSYPIGHGIELETSRGRIAVDLGYGGAIYASVRADAVSLEVTPEHHDELIAMGREIKRALHDHELVRHPLDDRLSGVYGTIFYDDLGRTEAGLHQRNVTIFADGELDRSPCGSGTSARLALLTASGELAAGEALLHDSIIGTRFVGRAGAAGTDGSIPTEVTGMAYRTGEHSFELDAADPLGVGFLLR